MFFFQVTYPWFSPFNLPTAAALQHLWGNGAAAALGHPQNSQGIKKNFSFIFPMISTMLSQAFWYYKWIKNIYINLNFLKYWRSNRNWNFTWIIKTFLYRCCSTSWRSKRPSLCQHHTWIFNTFTHTKTGKDYSFEGVIHII